jgi:arylsulfatase A-like enzyme
MNSRRSGLLGLFLLFAMSAAAAGATPSRPNIVFVLADDLGARDLGCYGSTFYETPNLDRLAARGMRFTDAYAASSVCSPTRASLLTGRYPARVGITDWLPGRPDRPDQPLARPALPDHLDLGEVTFAEALQEAGYRTGLVGKWHLGEHPDFFPEHQGFDVNIGGSGKGHPPSYFSPYRLPGLADGPPGEHLDERLTREAESFMRDAAAQGRPFLLYLCHYAVHTPLQAKPEVVAKYQARLDAQPPAGPAMTSDGRDGPQRVLQTHPAYAAMVESLDASVGRIVAILESLGLSENTIVIFTSDNGGLSTAEGSPTSNLPLRAGKGWAYEGGVREPLLVVWPGRVAPGSTTDAIVTSPDFFPTLLDLAGLPARPEQHVDGVSFASVLRDPAATLPERSIYWHYPHYSNQRGRPHGAIREGRWKLIEWFEDGRVELFDIAADIGETHDLASAQPERAAALLADLRAWRTRVGARMPTPNPGYKPAP